MPTLFNLLAEQGRLALHPMYTAKGKIDPTYIFRPGSIYAYPPIKRSPMLSLSIKGIAILAVVLILAGIVIGIYIATR